MEMRISNITDKETSSNENNETVDKVKCQLKKQINELKSIISEIERNLDIQNFGKTKIDVVNNPDVYNSNEYAYKHEFSNVKVQLEYQLYRYSGFYCVEFSETDYIFNFSSFHKYDAENIFAVQILNKDKKGSLGKWIMPMSIDLDDLISELPIDELQNIPYFLRTCRHYINCYFIRREQFNTLREITSCTRNCTLQANLGYTCINIELRGVHSTEDDLYVNIIIYLIYSVNEVRPHKVKVDSITQDELHTSMKKHLRTALMCFKTFDLHTAFDKMFNEKPFVWSKEDGNHSPIETNDLSNESEEEFLDEFSSLNKKPSVLRRKRRKVKNKKREVSQRDISNFTETFKNNEPSISSSNKKPVNNVSHHSVNQINTEIIKSTPHIKKKKQKKLKQAKLQFQLNDSSKSHTNNMSEKKLITEKLYKLSTSTPVSKNKQNPSKLIAITDIDDISDITINENN